MKRRKGLTGALLCLALLCLLPGCAPGRESREEGTRLWFTTALSGEGGWTGVSQAVGSAPYRGAADAESMLGALLAGPAENSGLTSPFPAGTRLVSWKRSGSILQVELSEEYGALTGVEQTLADYCVALTLVELDGVDGVRITVENGSHPRRILRREDVVFSGVEEEPVEVTAMLCFRRADSWELGAELRTFRLTESESVPLAVLEALLAGPSDPELVRLLPAGVEAYSARVDDGVCYADLSAALLEYVPDTEQEQELALRSITESLCSLSSVKSVQILVEGEPLERYGEVDPAQLGPSKN